MTGKCKGKCQAVDLSGIIIMTIVPLVSMEIRVFSVKIWEIHGRAYIMAIRVVEFSNGGYKIRKVFA